MTLANPFRHEPDARGWYDCGHLVQRTNADYAARDWYSREYFSVADLTPTRRVEELNPNDGPDATHGDPLVVRCGNQLLLIDVNGHYRACWAGPSGVIACWVADPNR